MHELTEVTEKTHAIKRKRGRPAFEPTGAQRKIVLTWAARGMPQEKIALKVGVELSTLRKNFGAELSGGRLEFEFLIANTAAAKMAAGDTTMIIFMCKVHLGWKDRQTVDVNHKHQSNDAINHRDYTQAQISAEIAALEERRSRAMARRRMVEALPNGPDKLVH